MAPLFNTLTMSNDSTSPKRRKGLLGRPSFFSRPSAANTAISVDTDATLIPLEITSSPRSSVVNTVKNTSVEISTFQPPIAEPTEHIKVTLLPSALSNTSLGPPSGVTPSNSLGGISASTSRNTVLPASHPILTSSGSTFIPPSLSLGFELSQGTNKPLPSLASAIKLPTPSQTTEGGGGPEKIGAESIITRKPVPPLPASISQDISSAIYVPIKAPAPAAPSAEGIIKTLPRSTSGTSIFGSTRLGRITSRSSAILRHSTIRDKDSVDVKAGKDGSGVGGMSLGRRISRRLSIDHMRPMFQGGSVKKRNVITNHEGGGGGKLDIQRWAQGAVSGVEAGEAPPLIQLQGAAVVGSSDSISQPSIKPKERLALPGLRSWRSKFSSSTSKGSSASSRPKNTVYPAGGSATESLRSLQKRDSWVEISGSVRSTATNQESLRSLGGALRRMEAAKESPAVSVVEASEPISTKVENAAIASSPNAVPISTDLGVDSPLRNSARRSSALLDALLARPIDDPVTEVPTFIPKSTPSPANPGLPTSRSAMSICQTTSDAMSPAVDDKSLLEPMRSPLADSAVESGAGFPGLSMPVEDEVKFENAEEEEEEGLTEAQEIIRDLRESTEESSIQLPHHESGTSFHTAKSIPSSGDITTDTIIPSLPRSRSKSAMDLSTSSSSLIDKIEREQGEGWWSAPRVRPVSVSTSTRPSSEIRVEDLRRQSSSSVLLHDRRFPPALPPKSPHRSILRPSKLQFADADEEEEEEEDISTPTRPSSRVRSNTIAPSPSPLSRSSRHRRDSTADSFNHLFFGPIVGTPILPKANIATIQHQDEITRLKERHARELDALLSALTAAKSENEELRDRYSRMGVTMGEESERRREMESVVETLRYQMRHLTGYKDGIPCFSAVDQTKIRAEDGRRGSVVDGSNMLSTPTKRQRRGISRTRQSSQDADEFGRLDGSPLDTTRR